MRKWLFVFLCLTSAVWSVRAQDARPGAPGVGDLYGITLGNGGYDVQHYTIDLDVDLDDSTIAGTVTIDARATQNLSVFNLDFLGFLMKLW